MRSKDEVFQRYKQYEAMLLCQWDTHIKCLFSDRGGKYTSTEFEIYLAKQGTLYCLTVHDSIEHWWNERV